MTHACRQGTFFTFCISSIAELMRTFILKSMVLDFRDEEASTTLTNSILALYPRVKWVLAGLLMVEVVFSGGCSERMPRSVSVAEDFMVCLSVKYTSFPFIYNGIGSAKYTPVSESKARDNLCQTRGEWVSGVRLVLPHRRISSTAAGRPSLSYLITHNIRLINTVVVKLIIF